MTLEAHYEQLVRGFETKRRELLNLLTQIVPKPTEMHRRKWRIKQLDNAIADIKTTIAACNLQLDDERANLEQLNTEYDRLLGQARKLTEDVKMLEGVTGMPAVMPFDADTDFVYDTGFFDIGTHSFAPCSVVEHNTSGCVFEYYCGGRRPVKTVNVC